MLNYVVNFDSFNKSTRRVSSLNYFYKQKAIVGSFLEKDVPLLPITRLNQIIVKSVLLWSQ
jgi:hypothetical protein